jgi:hypothetical protein
MSSRDVHDELARLSPPLGQPSALERDAQGGAVVGLPRRNCRGAVNLDEISGRFGLSAVLRRLRGASLRALGFHAHVTTF